VNSRELNRLVDEYHDAIVYDLRELHGVCERIALEPASRAAFIAAVLVRRLNDNLAKQLIDCLRDVSL
jgi:hypothetical protein